MNRPIREIADAVTFVTAFVGVILCVLGAQIGGAACAVWKRVK